MNSISLRQGTPADWPAISALLEANELPLDGARAHINTFVVAEANRETVACAGAELYGGLATAHDFGTDGTSHYAGPTLGFNLPKGPTISFSPQFGLNDNSVGTLWRFKVSYEVQQFRDWFRGWGKK